MTFQYCDSYVQYAVENISKFYIRIIIIKRLKSNLIVLSNFHHECKEYVDKKKLSCHHYLRCV